MKRQTALLGLALILAGFAGCRKSGSSSELVSMDGKSKIILDAKEIFSEANQELVLTGHGFGEGKIAADSITIGGQKTEHAAASVGADGSLGQTKLKIPGMLPLGAQDIMVGSAQFAKAVQVNPIQLEYMMWGTPDELNTVNKYLKDFETKFPNIRVKILHVPQMYDDKLKTLFAAKTPPDVMYMGLERYPSFVTRGVFLNLQPFVDRDNKEFRKEDFYPNLVELFKYKGNIYGIPKDFTTLALYYNKDMFKKIGLNFPNENWTWKDFLDASKKLTKDIDGDGKTEFGFVLETWMGQWLPWVWQNGGEIMDKSSSKWLMGDAAYIDKNADAVQFFADLIWKEGVAPKPSMTGDLGSKDMFMTGKVGMCTYGRWMCMDFKNIKGFDWDIAVLPKGKQRASTIFVVCYAIAAQTKHPEASWQLIKFLTGNEGQIAVAESGHAIPSRKSIANTEHFLEAKVIGKKINAKAFLDQVSYGRPVPTHPNWNEINERLGREMELLFLNKNDMTAKKTITNVQKEIEEILAKPVDGAELAKK